MMIRISKTHPHYIWLYNSKTKPAHCIGIWNEDAKCAEIDKTLAISKGVPSKIHCKKEELETIIRQCIQSEKQPKLF